MGDTQEVQLQIQGQEAKESNSFHTEVINRSNFISKKKFLWWIRMAIYTLFVLAGQTVGTILGRLYYDKGGNSKWLAALMLPAGFPILLPFYLLPASNIKDPTANVNIQRKSPSVLVLASAYFSVGILLAGDCMLYSIGYLYLPVSTYSLLCASQLAFNALFSFFLNSLKFTPFIINSLVVLTISSILLMFQNDDSAESTDYKVSKRQYAIGSICTLAASAGYGLMLSLTQWFFNKVLKKETFKVVLDMLIYPSLVSTCAIIVGLFVSGEWKSLNKEMEEFKLGKVSYVMTLVWTAVSWQVFSIGAIGLIFEVSSLFSNVISTLGLPVVPVLAVVVFNDKMSGAKVVALVLAFWGFVSYVYQHYLDDCKSKTEIRNVSEAAEASISRRNG